MKARIDFSDVFLFMGLILTGIGLFFWFGIGVSMTISGAIVLALGVAANIANATKPKDKR